MDLSKLSDADLAKVAAGDMQGLSDEALAAIATPAEDPARGKLFGVIPTGPLAPVVSGMRDVADKSREGLKMMTDAIPDPETTSPWANTLLGLPKTALEIGSEMSASMLDPETPATFGLTKGLGIGLASGPGKALINKADVLTDIHTPNIKRALTYRYNQPESYVGAAEGRELGMREGASRGVELGKSAIVGLNANEQKALGGLLRGEPLALPNDVRTKLTSIAEPIRREIDNLSSRLVTEGIRAGTITEEMGHIILDNRGKYLPRLYRAFEDPAIREKLMDGSGNIFDLMTPEMSAGAAGLQSRGLAAFENVTQGATAISTGLAKNPKSVRTGMMKQRQELSPEYSQALGSMKDVPALAVLRAVTKISHSIETSKLLAYVAEHPEWASYEARPGFLQIGKLNPRRYMDRTGQGANMGEMVDAQWGKLSGMYVHPEIARDLKQVMSIPTKGEKLFSELLNTWKYGKVIMNPATHSRNMISNSIMLDIVNGVDPQNQPKLLFQAAQDLRSGGRYYQEARKLGLLGPEYHGAEVGKLSEAILHPQSQSEWFPTFSAWIRGGAEGAGNLYQAEEQVYKLAAYIKHRTLDKLDPKSAIAAATEGQFDYSKISPLIEAMRSGKSQEALGGMGAAFAGPAYAITGSPFITYTSKALPAIARAGLKNPMRLYKYHLLFKASNKVAKEHLGLSDEEYDTIKSNARGQFVLLPERDMNGQAQTLDLSYILPWGDLGEQGGYGDSKMPPVLGGGGPLKGIQELASNKSNFTGKPIYNDQTDLDDHSGIFEHMYRSLLPSLAPPIPNLNGEGFLTRGGYSANKLMSTFDGRPDYFGRYRSLPTVLADTMLGLKASPQDPETINNMALSKLNKQAGDIKLGVRSRMRNKSLKDEEKSRVVDRAKGKIKGIKEEVGKVQKRKKKDTKAVED